MIALLTGIVAERGTEHIVLDCGGVGYEVSVPLRTLEQLPAVGQRATVHVVTHVREDAIQLFGFATCGDRRLFLRLVTVQGVGPKTALQALSTSSAPELQRALMSGDEKALCRIPGIGRKTAQRMILDLGEKVRLLDFGGPTAGATGLVRHQVWDDLVLALLDLGYARAVAEDATARLRATHSDDTAIEKLLREALRLVRS